MFIVPQITYWSAVQDLDYPDGAIDKIHKLLNPLSHLGNMEGTVDERSFIYTTASQDGPQAMEGGVEG
jgi:hypothetical protein